MTPDEETAIAIGLGKRFIARKDVMAIQGPKGEYRPSVCPCSLPKECKEHPAAPFTVGTITEHLQGRKSYGHYLISPEDNCTKLVAFDLDVVKEPVVIGSHECASPREAIMDPYHADHDEITKQLHCLADGLAYRLREVGGKGQTPVTVAMAFSGSKGVHVYGWFADRTHAKRARYLAELTLKSYKNCFVEKKGHMSYRHQWDFPAVEVEVFPKQDKVSEDSYGNLMRLPLGRNRKSGARSYFIKPCDADEFGFVEMDPALALEVGSL